MRTMKKQRLIMFFALMMTCVLLVACTEPTAENVQITSVHDVQPAENAVLSEPPEPQPVEQTVTFSAVGDNLIHSSLYKQANARANGEGYDFAYVYENVIPFFSQFDVNWMNQESLITYMEPSNYPMFSTPSDIGEDLYNAGWRVFALSNNHSYDKGSAGLTETLQFWDSMPDDVYTSGLISSDEADAGITLQEVNGITIAYLAFTETTNGLPTPSEAPAHVIYTSETERMQQMITRARELADAVVVGVHWGVEYSHTPSDAQKNLAANFTAWGADVVIGTHPHVMQPVEWVESEGRTALVAYSLGNFVSAQDRAPRMVGLCLSFEFTQTLNPDGTKEDLQVVNPVVSPTVTHYDGGFANNHLYMLSDYTQELAQTHGVRGNDPQFSLEWIYDLCIENIDAQFLPEYLTAAINTEVDASTAESEETAA